LGGSGGAPSFAPPPWCIYPRKLPLFKKRKKFGAPVINLPQRPPMRVKKKGGNKRGKGEKKSPE